MYLINILIMTVSVHLIMIHDRIHIYVQGIVISELSVIINIIV